MHVFRIDIIIVSINCTVNQQCAEAIPIQIILNIGLGGSCTFFLLFKTSMHLAIQELEIVNIVILVKLWKKFERPHLNQWFDVMVCACHCSCSRRHK
jgi:hypothetical protein